MMRYELKKQKFMDELSRRGWSIEDFAQKADMSFVQVYRVINGQRKPGNEFLAGTKHVLEADNVEEFFYVAELPKGNEIESG